MSKKVTGRGGRGRGGGGGVIKLEISLTSQPLLKDKIIADFFLGGCLRGKKGDRAERGEAGGEWEG